MTIWFLFGLMTIGAAFAVLWPLRSQTQPPQGGEDVVVYRDQLAELERDRAAGLIRAAEAEAARVEVARRLLAADAAANSAHRQESPGRALRRHRVAAVGVLVLLPAAALSLYAGLGSPGLAGARLESRTRPGAQPRSMQALLAQVETHLARNPQDGRGWEVIAPVYMDLARFDDAVRARQNALRINGATATREADYGEALTAAANGVVTADAKAALERAITLDEREPKARFLLGLAAEQDGKAAEAARIWHALLAAAPPGAPWADAVTRALARVDPSAPSGGGPSAADVAAAAELSPEARNDMVRGMVDRLAARLNQDGSDVEGWVRLVRAYVMLGEPDKAKSAVAEARRATAGDPEKLRRVNDAAKQFGLES